MYIHGASLRAHQQRQRQTQRGLAFMGRTARRAYSRAPTTRSGYRYRMQTRSHLRTRARTYFRN